MLQYQNNKMKCHYLIVIVTLLGGVWCTDTELTTTNESDMCASFKNCTCFQAKEYEIQCPSTKLDLVIHLVPDKYIQIDCYNQTDYKLDIFRNVNIDVDSFKVRFCLLPVVRFSNILQKFNITHLKHLHVEECKLGNNSLTQIDADFFEGISSLQSLSISSSTKTFGENVFETFPNLLKLYLEQNEFTEIGYWFENNPKLRVLHLSRNSLKNLPDGVFKKLTNLQELHLWKNQLTNISQNYFMGLKNLKSLELSLNSINFLEENTFSELNELVNVSLRSNKLGYIASSIFKNNTKLENIRMGKNSNLTIADYVFANLFNLKTMSMDQCHLKDIPVHTFENCTSLIDLNLSNNKLKTLNQNLFKTLTKLNTLNLAKNKISFLPDKIFSSQENLQYLNLEGNQLTTINKGTFDGLSSLKHLVLKENKISHIDSLAFSDQSNLIKLDLSHNHWVKPEYVFSYCKRLEQLILNHNNISTFLEEILQSDVYLKKLDLSYNNLEVLSISSLVKVSNYVKINVSHNHITYIDFEIAEITAVQNVQNIIQADAYHNSNISTTQVDVSNNPLTCGCNSFDFIQYLRDRLNPAIQTFVDIKINDDMKCYHPQELKHILIKDLYPEQIHCEFKDTKCPSKCKCFERPYDFAIIVDCSFQNLTEWPDLKYEKRKIELNMVGNLLETGPPKSEGYRMVKNLFLSNNKIKVFDWCPPFIEELKLDHNELRSIHANVLKALSTSQNFSKVILDNNPWNCDCFALDLQNFLKTYYNKIDVNSVLCENDHIPLIKKGVICKSKLVIIAQIVIPILGFFLLTAIVMALYFRYKQEIKIWLFSKNWCLWFVTEEELDKDKKYDIFLSFSHKDEDFVALNLVPSLEKSFKLCIHSRDWIPGELINDQIVDSVYNSRRTLVVLSNNFLESAWGKLEFLMAHKQSIDEGRPRVIVIKLGELNSDKMTDDFKAYIKTNTYVEWGEPWFWKKLLYALPHSSKNHSKLNQKHANIMLKIDDKFELVSQLFSQPESTPPVVCSETTLLKKNPLNFSISSSINNFQPEVPLIKD